jgi:hypothetical protein
MKTFVEDKTKEVLIVADDGCYAFVTDVSGQTALRKLNDARDILGTNTNYKHYVASQILPG